MLVLSRKVGERLVIGNNITLVINRIAGNRVTIGIEAPSDVRVARGELEPNEPATPAKVGESFDRVTNTWTESLPRLAK
jgi:carbon storage regulator